MFDEEGWYLMVCDLVLDREGWVLRRLVFVSVCLCLMECWWNVLDREGLCLVRKASVWLGKLVFEVEVWFLMEKVSVWWRKSRFDGEGWCLVEEVCVWWRRLGFEVEVQCLMKKVGVRWRRLVFGGVYVGMISSLLIYYNTQYILSLRRKGRISTISG